MSNELKSTMSVREVVQHLATLPDHELETINTQILLVNPYDRHRIEIALDRRDLRSENEALKRDYEHLDEELDCLSQENETLRKDNLALRKKRDELTNMIKFYTEKRDE